MKSRFANLSYVILLVSALVFLAYSSVVQASPWQKGGSLDRLLSEQERTVVMTANQPMVRQAALSRSFPVQSFRGAGQPAVVALPKAGGGGNGEGPGEAAGVGPCPCCSNEVWTAPTLNETYGLSPIGGIFEPNWITGQMWREVPVDPSNPEGEKKSQVLVFGIRPKSMIFARDYRGGTAWLFCGDEAGAWEDLKKQQGELLATYPNLKEEDIWVLVFPDGIVEKPPMVVETRTQAVLTQ
jgi:hypothetical protein